VWLDDDGRCVEHRLDGRDVIPPWSIGVERNVAHDHGVRSRLAVAKNAY
jgi:hypothetical protein